MILDTNLIIELRAGNEEAKERTAEWEAKNLPLRVPTVVLQELYVGVGAGSKPNENATEYEALLANKPVVPLDENIARRAGAIEGAHIASDEKPELGLADSVVAATGLIHNKTVVTDDQSDFDTVERLASVSVST